MISIEHLSGRSESFCLAETDGEQSLPVLVQATPGQSIHHLDAAVRDALPHALTTAGGVLFRGFSVPTPIDFKRFAASFGAPLASYEFGSTPRSKVFAGVYSSTEYPAHQFIPLHNEQAYTRPWPSHIWFHCIKASETGGETPIADSRLIYQRIPAEIRKQFASRELL
jgi:alpha-ketoglutarate-dependent taurine dioxygenase